MKYFILVTILFSCFQVSFSQVESEQYDPNKIYRILKTDGGEIFGKILSSDSREIKILTIDNREIIIPQYVISKIEETNMDEFNSDGTYVGEDRFATRYFITTNGLPIKKGDHYVQWNLFGPDFQFGVADNLGVGIMTSWVGIPIIGSIKYSFELGDNAQLAVGGLFGTASWVSFDTGGALPFATLSFGDRSKNIAFTGGYGAIFDGGDVQGRALGSVAGMVKVGKKVSLVFDSFIVFPGQSRVTTTTWGVQITEDRPGFALIIPGVRWHQKEGAAFQFGFSGVSVDGELLPVPIPMVQWYRSL